MENSILKHALINAIEHDGKAETQSVLGKIISEKPELKTKIKSIINDIKKTVEEVNSWPKKEQEKKLKDLFGVSIEEIIEEDKASDKLKSEKGLPPLPNAEKYKKIVMRMAPYPSGPLHIGNARMVILNDEYTKMYKGKLYLVIDDTIGSEDKFVQEEAYDLIIEGLRLLGIKWDELIYKSDRLELFYDAAEELIRKGLAYVCECKSEELRECRVKGISCVHRDRSVEENLKKWDDMLSGKFKEGEAVLRLKTDIKHPNPAFRDRVLLRIVEREHPKVGRKYIVWPLLEFSWAVDDQLLGMTHILRGKDLVMEDMMENYIWDKLGLKKPEFIHYGMLNIEEFKLSKTQSRKAIETGEYKGWDDPRTWSLQSLAKRGILPEAIRKFILSMGLSLADVNVPAEILYAENRKIIDPIANRYFVVFDPVEISVKGSPKISSINAHLHPDFPDRGQREIPVETQKIYIEKNDFEKLQNQEVGLINLFSVKMGKNVEFLGKEIKMTSKKIHWVSEPNVKIKVVMPDGSEKIGIAEPSIKKLKKGDLIQMQRIGFARVEKADKDTVLYFAHK